MTSPYLHLKEAAAYLKIGSSTLYRIKDTIPHRVHGGRIVFHVADLDSWSAAQVRTPKVPSQSKFQMVRQRLRSLKTEDTAIPTSQKEVG